MEKQNTLKDIGDLVVKKGQGVLSTIVKRAREAKVSFTNDDLYALKDEICSRLAQDSSKSKKSKENCIVQPGQILPLALPTKPAIPTGEHSESGVLAGAGGVTKTTGIDGKIRYTYISPDGKTQELKQS